VPFIIGIGGLILVSSRLGVRVWVKWRNGVGLRSGWEKDGLLLDGEAGVEGQCDETFGLEDVVREGYGRWKSSQMMLS
jgi:hypothetical protein